MAEAARRRFSEQMDILQARLLEMAGMVESEVKRAIAAVFERDASVADRVKARDEDIDALEVELDDRVMDVLALHQPMASDLRQIITVLKVANDLERVGDHAVNISKAARRLSEEAPFPEVRELREMARITEGMLADALAAYTSRNPGTARMVCATDDQVDDLRKTLFRLMITHMMEDPRRITAALDILLVSQNLERIADLSTNISEDVVFLVEGQIIKHQTPPDQEE